MVENLCTIPLNLPAARAVARALRGRRAVLHHHDPPWQRPAWAHVTELPPDDPAWRHVTINRLTEAQTAYGSINSVHDLIRHPQLRTRRMDVHGRTAEVPAPPYVTEWEDAKFRPAPGIGEHGPLPEGVGLQAERV